MTFVSTKNTMIKLLIPYLSQILFVIAAHIWVIHESELNCKSGVTIKVFIC